MLDRRTVVVGLTAAAVSGRAAAAGPLAVTPQEMLGPFYPEHPLSDHDFDLTRIRGHSARARGEVIELVGRILRRDGTPVAGAAVEVWQANAAGRYRHPNDMNKAPLDPDFQGYAKLLSGKDGSFRVITVMPGAYPAPIGMRAPHVHFDVQSRNCRLSAQMYFPGEPLNAADPLLSTLAARHLDPRLALAQRDNESTGLPRFRYDMVLWS
jgi:protocatechuate 3,4-dioxygenase, beta subunit